ncbi:PREDICTED: LOW QUALITY PROTEIN: selenium-binding protein 1-like [Calidris pugnax]|uniref:LOW QUALITY PROTEIN: selenium-binding protein 1-like n=1 Tax=Calidris pugnax TaxID=198806 RepID=UPI00071CE9EE|nr:PREDICTED: LOW QUALITY PROTEIN: selenium-binding protein 1-like [Calidris pugnax]XP_014816306.1 PREDICTED: LOW QUALITY PROTEIN: selenium-binding protein 1-like [Calidris pugnax]
MDRCRVQCYDYPTCPDVKAPREEVAYVTCTYRETCIDQPDFLATIDLNPRSPHYCQVIHRLPMPNLKDELHASGWSTGCTCFDNVSTRRNKLILPCLISSRIYVVDVGSQCRAPKICKMIEPVDVFWKCNKGYLNVPRSLPNGDILIANVGDPAGNSKGGFIVLDGETFELKGNWENECEAPPSGYDFWYQPRYNVLVSSAGMALKRAGRGFCPSDLKKGVYGRRLNVWNLSCRSLTQCFDLGEDSLPLSVKFLHNPEAAEGYVSCALSGVVYRFYKCEASAVPAAGEPARPAPAGTLTAPCLCFLCRGRTAVEEVIRIPAKDVSGWIMPKMPAFTVDLIISTDDKYLYLSNWLHGDIRQYELSKNCKPRLVGQVFVGGSILRGGPVTVCRDEELKCQPEPLVIKCKRVYGGPCKLQLSLDGKRLYVTNSFYSTWDKQFYPNMVREGSVMLQIDVDTEKGGLTVNKNFLVDFGKEPNGPCLAHEIHFACGDSTSDILA